MAIQKPKLDLSFEPQSFRSGSSHIRRLTQHSPEMTGRGADRYITSVQVCCTTWSTGAAGEDDQ
jgi:hypothetical protein